MGNAVASGWYAAPMGTQEGRQPQERGSEPSPFFYKKLDRTYIRSPLRTKAPQVRVCAGCTKIINIFRLFCAIRKIPKKIKKM